MVVPEEGSRYKHHQIRDVVYIVALVDTKKGKVYLIDDVHGQTTTVSFAQLQVNYKEI